MADMARLGVGLELVGRQRELAELTAALERAASGRAAGVLLDGDAGVGKSRLIAEAVAHAEAAGFTVLVGRCLDTAESSLPYLPFAEVVGRLATTHAEVLDARPELRRLLPGGKPPGEQRDRELAQLRVFDAVLSALSERGCAAPVLLVVEDLHWADRSSRDLLVFVLSRLASQRLAVVASYRGDELHRRHPLRPMLSELVRLPAVDRVHLEPLDAGETLDLVRRLAEGTLPEGALLAAARRSEGNAFFAEELVSACRALPTPPTTIAGEPLPHGLAEVLLARVERLSPTTQRVLRLAAVAGRRVRHERLAAVSGLADDELEQALREAVAHHVLVPEAGPAGGDAYAFRHALLHDAVYVDLLPGERTRLHAAYARLLARSPAGTEPGRAAELAHHALAAHELPVALAASVEAAAEADRRQGPAEVLLHAERALTLWPAVPEAEAVAGVPEVTVTRWAAWGASATGEPDRGIALARRALELADQRGDPHLSADLRVRYALRLLELSGREDESVAAAERAVELLAGEPPSGDLAWAHGVLGRANARLDRMDAAAEHARTALALARAVPGEDADARAAEADALVTVAVCEEHAGRAEHARALLGTATALARESGNLGVELRAQFIRGISLLDEGRLAEAGDAFAAGEQRAVATGTIWGGYGLELRVAHVIARFLRGDWDAAEAAAEPGEAVSATVAGRLAAAGLLAAVGRGRFEAAERRWSELAESRPSDDQVVLLLGQTGAELALWQGRPRLAAQRIDEALRGLRALVPGHHVGEIMLCALGVAAQAELVAEGALAPEVAEAAAGELTAAAELAARRGVPRAGVLGPEGRAWLRQVRAELGRARGRSSPSAWAEVVAAFGYESGYRQAYARLRRAEALLVAPGPAGAREAASELRSAWRTAEELGAAPLARAVRSLAARAGVRLEVDAADPRPPDPLTPRERSVLTLVAGGRTNRQVGAELYISEKTVSVHLSRVMAKLGAASRTEAVSIAYARGLLSPTG